MRSIALIIFYIFSWMYFTVHSQTDLVFSVLDSRNGLSDSRIRNITQLTDGRMVITTEGVTNIFDGTTYKQLHLKPESSTKLPGYYGFHHSYVDGEHVWIKNYQELLLIDANTLTYVENQDSVFKSMGLTEKVADLFIDINKNYWIITVTDELMLYSSTSNSIRLFRSNISYPENNQKDELYDIAVVKNNVFLLYNNGLIICYDLQTGKFLYKTNSLGENEQAIYNRTLMVVQSGDILYMLRNSQKGLMQAFDTKKRTFSTVLNTDYWLNTISIDSKNNIWVSCKNGLWHINNDLTKKHLISTFRLIDGTDVTSEASTLYNDPQGGFWIGTFNHGLLYYHADRFKFKNIGKTFFGLQVQDVNINFFSETEEQHILVGASNGLYDYDPVNSTLTKLSETVDVETFASGKTDLENRRWFDSYINNNKSVWGNRNQEFSSILKDKQNLVWLGTHDGLYVLQLKNNKIYTLYTDDGLVNNSIKGLLEDRNGMIWVTTSSGISRIAANDDGNELHFSISNFNQYDGVIGKEFIVGSTFVSSTGLLYMGGVNGFNVIDPAKPWIFSRLQKPLFTGLTVFGDLIKTGESYNGRTILTHSITNTEKVELNYNQNFISLDFSALNYVNPSQTYYKYQMEGIDDTWREIASSNGSGSATYTNLTPGTYLFKVMAANSSKKWSADYAQITIVIHPPFWKTPIAYTLYMMLILFLIYLLLSNYRSRTQKQLERRNEEKLNQMKFAFFTNVSHEFRTPLTLIITPLETFLKEIKGTNYEPKLQSIYRHAQDLQNLVNQLLDFRRLEVSGEKLNLTYGDIVEFVQQYEELFKRLALEKNISFSISTELSDCFMYFDNNKLYKILNNLLSNAFKFTPQGGKINIRLYRENDFVKIEVTDTGIGISENDLPNVFNRFYQASNVQSGSGIGLHLVKEYVQLHSGEIRVDSEPGVQTMFALTIPTTLIPPKSEKENTATDEIPIETSDPTPNKDFKLLVVEDNDDLRHFLVLELQKIYHVLEAPDGQEGLRLAQTEMPDLIVSDVMMPKMNGIELCKQIKSDLLTSHIQVILLTARTSEEHKLIGYQSGADEYLSKPFNLEILLLRIAKLIEQQNRRKVEFAQKIEVNPKEITITSLDEQLIQKALTFIEKNMDNCDYSVQQFSMDLGMDRTVLYKKLQFITGLAPLEFIRSIRMKRAAQLLVKGQLPVAEVAEMVGFNTQKYFSKYFKEAFGLTPSQYAHKDKSTDL